MRKPCTVLMEEKSLLSRIFIFLLLIALLSSCNLSRESLTVTFEVLSVDKSPMRWSTIEKPRYQTINAKVLNVFPDKKCSEYIKVYYELNTRSFFIDEKAIEIDQLHVYTGVIMKFSGWMVWGRKFYPNFTAIESFSYSKAK